ncbi:hypothetical protein ACIRRA_22160 [Nocardia sp. NPDC101769]|uniref:hypothetical protein n=1 Tax=Nocardia sp. NPDC101769 TaxID=3364333 RepID=UPI00380FE951
MHWGIVSDGGVKVALAAAYTIGGGTLGHRLGVETWLMAASGAALLIAGGIEITYLRRRPLRTYLRMMVAYDSGWVAATVVGVLLVWRGDSTAGVVWIGYQTVAPLALAALLAAATPAQATTATHTADRTR